MAENLSVAPPFQDHDQSCFFVDKPRNSAA